MKFGRKKINLRLASANLEQWFTGHSPQVGSDLCFLTQTPPRAVAEHFRGSGCPSPGRHPGPR